MAGSNVKATVNVGGQDPNCTCDVEDSEEAPVEGLAGPNMTDEFGAIPADEVRGRLDTFFADLQNNPNDQGYIIIYGTPREIAVRKRLIESHIRLRRFDSSRITIVEGPDTGSGVNTKLYRIPPGAENPAP